MRESKSGVSRYAAVYGDDECGGCGGIDYYLGAADDYDEHDYDKHYSARNDYNERRVDYNVFGYSIIVSSRNNAAIDSASRAVISRYYFDLYHG